MGNMATASSPDMIWRARRIDAFAVVACHVRSLNGQSLKVRSVARAFLGSGPIKIRRFLGKSDKRQASVEHPEPC